MILFGITELWLSFWSEVHYNSLYTSGGDILITLKWIFLLTLSYLHCQKCCQTISLYFIPSMNLQMFLLEYQRKSIGSSREMADYEIIWRTEF